MATQRPKNRPTRSGGLKVRLRDAGMVEAGVLTAYPVLFKYGFKHGIAGPESGVSYDIDSS